MFTFWAVRIHIDFPYTGALKRVSLALTVISGFVQTNQTFRSSKMDTRHALEF